MNPGVAQEASSALCNLAMTAASNRQRMARAGAPSKLLAVLEAHKSDARVCAPAAAALAALAHQHPENQRAMSAAEGIPQLVGALRSPLRDDHAAAAALCEALASLATLDELQEKLVGLGAVQAAVAAVKLEGSEEGGVWGAAGRLLIPLACDVSLKGRLVAAGDDAHRRHALRIPVPSCAAADLVLPTDTASGRAPRPYLLA